MLVGNLALKQWTYRKIQTQNAYLHMFMKDKRMDLSCSSGSPELGLQWLYWGIYWGPLFMDTAIYTYI